MINIYVPRHSPHTALSVPSSVTNLLKNLKSKCNLQTLKSKNVRNHCVDAFCFVSVTIYRGVVLGVMQGMRLWWYLSPYSRSSWSQSPLTVPHHRHPVSQTSEHHQHTTHLLGILSASLYFHLFQFCHIKGKNSPRLLPDLIESPGSVERS